MVEAAGRAVASSFRPADRRAHDVGGDLTGPLAARGHVPRPTEALGRLEHLRADTVGSRNLTHHTSRGPLVTGGCGPRLHRPNRPGEALNIRRVAHRVGAAARVNLTLVKWVTCPSSGASGGRGSGSRRHGRRDPTIPDISPIPFTCGSPIECQGFA